MVNELLDALTSMIILCHTVMQSPICNTRLSPYIVNPQSRELGTKYSRLILNLEGLLLGVNHYEKCNTVTLIPSQIECKDILDNIASALSRCSSSGRSAAVKCHDCLIHLHEHLLPCKQQRQQQRIITFGKVHAISTILPASHSSPLPIHPFHI
jgi:hypothetical protein